MTGLQVSRFIPQYLRDNPKLPPLDDVLNLEVRLVDGPDGYAVPREGAPAAVVKLRDLSSDAPRPYHASAIQKILERVRDHFNAQNYMGVYVAPDPFEIDENGKDLRAPGKTDLHLVITVGTVTELRTLASGERVNPDRRVNADEHARVAVSRRCNRRRARAPTRAVAATVPAAGNATVATTSGGGDLLRRDKLDDYAFWLSRHPGRRADVALSPGLEPGSVNVDYLLTENKPWSVFAQASNTGTKETNDWRERFGFFHNQLTGNDDIISIDYLTAGFEDTNSINASYEAPIGDSRWFRWRVTAGGASSPRPTSASATTSSPARTGTSAANSSPPFTSAATSSSTCSPAHATSTRKSTTRCPAPCPARKISCCRTSASGSTSRLSGSPTAQTSRSSGKAATDVSQEEIDNLGRPSPDDSWVVLQWDLSHSVYLEPLLDRKKWQNPNAPEATLAHEIYLGIRGQYAFDDARLIPIAEQTLGGFYTVRGYPESAIAGDTVVVGTAEYRFHCRVPSPCRPSLASCSTSRSDGRRSTLTARRTGT
jgi:hypothetical protein